MSKPKKHQEKRELKVIRGRMDIVENVGANVTYGTSFSLEEG